MRCFSRRAYTLWELMIVLGLVSFLLMMSASALTSLVYAGRAAVGSQRQVRAEARLVGQLRDDLRGASSAEVIGSAKAGGSADGAGSAMSEGRGPTLRLTNRLAGAVEYRCGATAVERWEVPIDGAPRRTETFTLELAVPQSWQIVEESGVRHVQLDLMPQDDLESRWVSRQAIRPVRVTARSIGVGR